MYFVILQDVQYCRNYSKGHSVHNLRTKLLYPLSPPCHALTLSTLFHIYTSYCVFDCLHHVFKMPLCQCSKSKFFSASRFESELEIFCIARERPRLVFGVSAELSCENRSSIAGLGVAHTLLLAFPELLEVK